MAKRRRNARDVERRQISLRLAPSIIEGVDSMARDIRLTRNQLIERMLRDMLKLEKQMEKGGLFDDLTQHLERIVEESLRRATREGGIDLALHRAGEIKRRVKKGANR